MLPRAMLEASGRNIPNALLWIVEEALEKEAAVVVVEEENAIIATSLGILQESVDLASAQDPDLLSKLSF